MRMIPRQDVKQKRKRKISVAVLVCLVLVLLVIQVYAQTAVYRLALQNESLMEQISSLEEKKRQLSRRVPGEGILRQRAMEQGMIPMEQETVTVISVLED